MYLEGLRNEKLIVPADDFDGPPTASPPPKPGDKPQQLGPQAVDMSKVGKRTVHLTEVKWGPPE